MGGSMRRYRPQRDFLSLLNLGDGRALASKWGIALEGNWAFTLKDRIDRRFVRRFQGLGPAGAPPPPVSRGAPRGRGTNCRGGGGAGGGGGGAPRRRPPGRGG